ncbi:MAG: hypothetical protein A3F68_07265 [Acidobacteria bacterium RIFCSPLOWO2_12_FULL_54_10]|nr:MAG: hypothetical protein A3F68_07265 [Acidobacteria bacterium RIFCSPLOWO2_12_FULL_54_10]
MNSAELIQLIQKDIQRLISMLIPQLRSNIGTSHYRRLTEEQMFQRLQTAYSDLILWLQNQDDAPLRAAGESSGRQRFVEGIPLGQTVLALVLAEKHFWRYLRSSAIAVDDETQEKVNNFFQKRIYYTSRGYESALAESGLSAPPVQTETHETSVTKPQAEGSMEISRGGQVGEQGG